MDICIVVVCISWLIVKTIIDSNSSGPLKLGQFNARKKQCILTNTRAFINI